MRVALMIQLVLAVPAKALVQVRFDSSGCSRDCCLQARLRSISDTERCRLKLGPDRSAFFRHKKHAAIIIATIGKQEMPSRTSFLGLPERLGFQGGLYHVVPDHCCPEQKPGIFHTSGFDSVLQFVYQRSQAWLLFLFRLLFHAFQPPTRTAQYIMRRFQKGTESRFISSRKMQSALERLSIPV